MSACPMREAVDMLLEPSGDRLLRNMCVVAGARITGPSEDVSIGCGGWGPPRPHVVVLLVLLDYLVMPVLTPTRFHGMHNV